jgi:predicted nucleotidyltransferase
MALHDYASQILGNRFTIKVLKTLLRYRGKVFTIRELARVTHVSHPEVSKVVKELEAAGVVRLKPIGRAYQIILNDESYILKSMIEPVFRAERETVNHLISTIRPFFQNRKIVSAAIFGSVARGEEKQTSDVDLLVVSKDKDIANECIAKANTATLSTFATALSPLIMDKQELARRRNEKLVKSILQSYIIIYGKDLREICLDKNS